jgi:hypothetical protein
VSFIEESNCDTCRTWIVPTEVGCPTCGRNKANQEKIAEIVSAMVEGNSNV